MPRKTIIIFIAVFIIVGAAMLGFYYYYNKTTNTTAGTTTAGYNSFNPFANTSSTTTTSKTANPTDSVNTSETAADTDTSLPSQPSIFHKLTDFSVAGSTYFEDMRALPTQAEATQTTTTTTPATKTTTTTKKTTVKQPQPKFEVVPALRYVERVTGHIDEMYLDTKIVGEVSNSTIPSIYEAVFDSKAQTIIYRYLSDDDTTIESFMATLGGKAGEFLPENVIDISLSPDKTKFFYLTKTQSGVIGTTRAFGETKSTQVFTSSFDEWLSQWIGAQKIYLTSKASASVPGSIFSLNTTTGSLTKVFGGVMGLTTLANSDGSLLLYSSSASGEPRLGIFNVNKHTTTSLDLDGLPEKCVWAHDNITIYCAIPDNISGGQYPDLWYQGKASFDDRFVSINTTTGSTTTIADSASNTPLDGTHLFLNKVEDQLFFINKKDSTLWSLDLK